MTVQNKNIVSQILKHRQVNAQVQGISVNLDGWDQGASTVSVYYLDITPIYIKQQITNLRAVVAATKLKDSADDMRKAFLPLNRV